MRVLVPAAICLALTVAAAARGAPPPGVVDLDRPGVLQRLERDDPARYAAIRDILKVSAPYPCQASTLRALQARLDLKDVACGALLLTSYPARRTLSFELQGTTYGTRIVVPPAEHPVPADFAR